MKTTASLIYLLGLILTACQAESSTIPPPSSFTTIPAAQEDNEMALSLTMPVDTGPQGLIDKAKEDLAQRLEVSVDNITVIAVIGQEFSMDGFYCRTSHGRTAKEESQSVMSGHSVLLSASGRRYEYHISDQTVVFCRPLR